MPHEGASKNGGIAASYREAATGKIIWTDPGSGDNGRGCCGPMTAGVRGWQFWSGAGGLWDVSHKSVGSKPSSSNFTMWWGADLTRAAENGTSISPGLTTTGMTSCNGTKSTPCLTADIFGDWREELVLATTGSTALHIYTTTTPTTNRLYTLMHDGGYRISVSSEQAAYNQPPEPGIYIGPTMTLPLAKPKIKYYDGSIVSADLPVHVYSQTPVNASLKVYGNKSFALPMNLNGMVKSVAIYDISGKLIQKTIVKKDNLNLQKDFGIANGLYMVKVKGAAKEGI
jgi:rhamnogalacturonan endolyase